jgi:2-amino-4-hydroxy-6-hydroxymethyldihydropteridine diphosphokinase
MSFSPASLPSFRSTVFVALGSNLDDPSWQVQSAFREIDDIPDASLVKVSSLYQTAPVGIADQPMFINAVAQIETTLSPHDFLRHLEGIEASHGRQRGERDGPRTLDLDILLFNDWQIDDEHLTTPHPRMHQRAFVLVPLAEIAPEALVPGHGTARELLARIGSAGVRLLADAAPQDGRAA